MTLKCNYSTLLYIKNQFNKLVVREKLQVIRAYIELSDYILRTTLIMNP